MKHDVDSGRHLFCVIKYCLLLKLIQVFLHRGQLHIIPKTELPAADGGGSPALCDAVSCVRTKHSVTVASHDVQQALQRRISGYREHRIYVIARVCSINRHAGKTKGQFGFVFQISNQTVSEF